MQKRYKVLITGSSGMLGVDLSQELRRDYRVYGVDVARRSLALSKAEGSVVTRFFNDDITNKKGISNIIAAVKPDVVVHTAAWTDVDGCELDKKKAYKINCDGTKNVALACKKAAAVLIYISTDFVFDGKRNRPYCEGDRVHPLSVYGDSKLRGELAVKKALKEHFILRTSWLYGKHGKNFVDTIVNKAKTEKALKVVDDQVGSPTYTKDLAKAIHVLLDKIFEGQGPDIRGQGVYHVSNAGSVSWYEYAKKILQLMHLKTKVVPISSKELARPARRPAMSVLDNGKFTRLAGFKLRRWDEALKQYLS